MEVSNTTTIKLSVEDLKQIVQKEITNINYVSPDDKVTVFFDIGNDPTWDGPGTSPILKGVSVSVTREKVGTYPSPASVFSCCDITDIRRGLNYRDGGSYDVTCVINGNKHKFFRKCGLGGDRKLYMRANSDDLVKADVADRICEFLDKTGN